MRGTLVAAFAMAVLAGTARAETEAEVEREAEASAAWSASAGVGAGFVGGLPVSAIDVRGDVAWDGGAAGIGARMRAVGDGVADEDWDEVADWIAIVRYLVVRNRADREAGRLAGDGGWRVAGVAGELGDVHVGSATIVDGYTSAAYSDRRQTGLHLRIAREEAGGEIVVGDLARGTMIAASGYGPAGPLVVGATAAIDPRAPVHEEMSGVGMIETAPLVAVAANVAVEARRERARGAVGVDVGWEPGLGAGAAIVASGAVRVGDQAVIGGRAEVGAGTGGWIAAPFGPLYLRLRDEAGDGETLVDRARAGDLGGAGAAVALHASLDGLGLVAAGVRARPGLPAEIDARLALPAGRGVQAAGFAAWMPAADDALLVGAEAHVELGRRLWSGLELGRQYAADDGLYAARPVWQVTAWFGWTRSTD